jgi:predicted helicase
MKNKKLAKVYHYDLYGKRDEKYKFLDEKSVNNIEWNELEYKEPYYFFVPKDFDAEESYRIGFRINSIFKINSNGIETKCDSISIHFSENTLNKTIDEFKTLEVEKLKLIYSEKSDSSGWSFIKAKNSILNENFENIVVNYRPFDKRYTILTKKSGGFIGRSRFNVMKHFLFDNLGLILPRQTTQEYRHIFISKNVIEGNFTASAKLFGTGNAFPLYLYPEAGERATLDQSGSEPQSRTPNLDMKLVGEIAKGIGLEFRDVAPWDEDGKSSLSREDLGGLKSGKSPQPPLTRGSTARNDIYFAPIDLLDYIYAVLHSPAYREKYKEFLKIDFPRVPYPKDKKKFWQLVDLGSQIRQLHLLETADKYITSYPNDGSNIVERKMTKNSIGYEQTGNGIGRVWINDEQYFDGVPEVAWEFYIGGYQPAQKWLKDRVSTPLNNPRPLTYEDINHYQKIIVALTETDRLMKEVDSVGVE